MVSCRLSSFFGGREKRRGRERRGRSRKEEEGFRYGITVMSRNGDVSDD